MKNINNVKLNNDDMRINKGFDKDGNWIGSSNIQAAFLILTENCNLRCRYCYEREGNYCKNNMSNEIAFKSIDFIADGYIKNGRKELPNITFFGGEPLLCPELIEDIVDYCEERYPDIKFIFSIITNGTIYNEKVEHALERLYHYNPKRPFSIQLSIDGIPEVQDKNRPTAGGTASSELIEKNIPKFKDFLARHQMNPGLIHVHACISHETLPLMYESYKYIRKDLDIKLEFAWVMESEWTKEDEDILEEQLNHITVDLGNDPELLDMKCFPIKNFHICSGCSMGKTFCTITPNGDIFPCHRFFFYSKANKEKAKDIIIGNLNNIPILDEENRDEFFNFYPNKVSDKPCQVCAACNYEYTGDIYKMPNDSQIRFMPIINKYKDMYIEICRKKGNIKNCNNNSSNDNCNGNNCSCNNHKGSKENNDDIINAIGTMSEILNNLNERISLIEDKLEKIDKIIKIGEIIYNE